MRSTMNGFGSWIGARHLTQRRFLFTAGLRGFCRINGGRAHVERPIAFRWSPRLTAVHGGGARSVLLKLGYHRGVVRHSIFVHREWPREELHDSANKEVADERGEKSLTRRENDPCATRLVIISSPHDYLDARFV